MDTKDNNQFSYEVVRKMDRLAKWSEQQELYLSEEQYKQLSLYETNLLSWNAKMNLTAITSEPEIESKHFIDSLSILPWIPQKPVRLIDVGTGAGFPGLPIKIARPDISLTLLDSLRKRIHFLQDTVSVLGLADVTCIHARAEDWQKEHRCQYDICTARAVAKLSTLAAYALPLVKPGGLFLAMKGLDVNDEIGQALPAIKKLHGTLIEVKQIFIPPDITHSVVVIRADRV